MPAALWNHWGATIRVKTLSIKLSLIINCNMHPNIREVKCGKIHAELIIAVMLAVEVSSQVNNLIKYFPE